MIIRTDEPILSWITAISTIILAFATIWLVVVTNRNTRKSNEELVKSNDLLRTDMLARLRPRFAITNPSLVLFNSNPTKVKFDCRPENQGSIPLRNIKIHHYKQNTKPTLIDIVRDETEIKKQEKSWEMTLEPQWKLQDLNAEWELSEREQKELWVIIWSEFEALGNKEETITAIRFIDMNPIGVDTFIYEDIKDARKKLKDFSDGKIGA